MGKWLFLLFTVVPVLELWLLIEIGRLSSAWVSIGLVIATGMLGTWLAKREGLRVLREWQGTVQRGQVPEEGLTSAALILVGGVLLVTPGVLSDALGIALLVPVTRRWIARIVRRRIEAAIQRGTLRVSRFGPPGPFGQGPFGGAGEREVQGEATIKRPPEEH